MVSVCCSSWTLLNVYYRTFQDRRFSETGAAVGRVQELSSDELRQTVALAARLLQERNHLQDSDSAKTSLPVLSVLSVITASQTQTYCRVLTVNHGQSVDPGRGDWGLDSVKICRRVRVFWPTPLKMSHSFIHNRTAVG